ncbi:hypothetical protein B0A54_17828 [Friedmanniomyces endolithicus]|uniref:AMP-dependent synthetase/ligase domain-containing protein n=2 Tax=Friedmanniomyces endolithicus TaxID=329885 RepID=A0A4U0TQ78_9PEZI|nr:hypothetical protein B0A54_17828 [Friedmanniomyces endolithicus]
MDVVALTRTRMEEWINFLRTLETDNVVVPGADASKTVDSALQDSGAQSPVLRLQLDSEASQQNDWANLSSLARDGAQHDIDQQVLLDSARSYDPERIALIMFTSGTSSGKPKDCPRRQN